ncbi:cupin domain-containing protein [Aliiglaciecola sp. 3_MG-2023]|uniref:cupin domain-containing protein n=1 Tax=Aliiglaciecola sp. 3_MG-2023 TaxID=3062644 RepID=UPI0026E1903F|nr:cupin domain-containing protein [Aliiglaciecola sp. 3_MG-2023]MDO6694403.1 cupin domain-containing protein [Aliiglaciecola sp. 3_MG-2023]
MLAKTLLKTFAIIKPDLSVATKDVSDSIYQQLDHEFSGFKDHSLVSAHSFTENWQTWEMHPTGDELVVLLSGQCKLIIRVGKQDQEQLLKQQGDFAVVPKGHWHTAHCDEATSLLFITPGEATQNSSTPN